MCLTRGRGTSSDAWSEASSAMSYMMLSGGKLIIHEDTFVFVIYHPFCVVPDIQYQKADY